MQTTEKQSKNNSKAEATFKQQAELIKEIQQAAFQTHANVNQTYDSIHPYSFHLEMVAQNARQYIQEVCHDTTDILPILFGAYFHDSIEDARLTYNDVMKIARKYMNEEKAFLATELVYALTNDKGRTRAERAGENYYKGIRAIPYAPFLKACDRLANMSYSHTHNQGYNNQMGSVYAKELSEFIQHLSIETTDLRFRIPQQMLDRLKELSIPS